MALSNHDQSQIREYLLGKLSDDEQQRIEERLMVEDELFDEFEVSKDELVEEYRAGDLAQNDRQWFEEHFLATSEGRERHAFALAMDCLHPGPDPLPSPAPAPPPPVTFLERLRGFLRTRPVWLVPAAAAVLITVTAFIVFRPTRPQNSLAVTLRTNAIERSPGETRYPVVHLTPDVGEVRMSLLLPEAGVAGTTYVAELNDRVNRKPVKSVSNDQNSVLVVIPAGDLHPGLYSLKLTAVDAQGNKRKIPGDYLFEITN